MKLYPYSTIKTQNLKTLLLASRVVAVIGYVLLIVALIAGMKAIFGSFGGSKTLNSGVILTMPNKSGATSLLVAWELITSLGIIMLSGFGAAVVSIENKYLTKEKIE